MKVPGSVLVLLVTTVVLSTRIGCTSQQTANTENVADDDEIALEDYVDSELPNFSGDVSSAILGDTTGYDVHIEVKIANKSKDKNDAPESNNQQPEIYPSSPKNHLKAKKILDLIIEKLKHKKDAREKEEDGSDIDIEESDDVQLAVKGKKKDEDEINDPTDEEGSQQVAAKTTDEFSMDTKSNTKEASPVKNQQKISSVQTKAKDKLSSNLDDHSKAQHLFDIPKHLFDIPKHSFDIPKHSFDIPKASKSETFSLPVQSARAQHMPKTSTLTHDDDIPAKKINSKAHEDDTTTKTKKTNKKADKLHASKFRNKIADEYANDEIRVKVPQFLNKSEIFTRILKMIDEDTKKAESVKSSQTHAAGVTSGKSQTNGFNPAKQNELDLEKKTPNISLPFYNYLLLKKLQKHEGMSSPNVHDLNSDQHLPSDAVAKEVGSTKAPFHHIFSNVNNVDLLAKSKSIDNEDDLPSKKIEKHINTKKDNNDNQDEILVKKPDVPSNFSQDNSIEPLPEFPGVPINPMEEISEKVKLRESKDDSSEREKGEVIERAKSHDEKEESAAKTHYEKEEGTAKSHDEKEESTSKAKSHEKKNSTTDQQLNDLSRNDAFVPNNVASKSFQENLEPAEVDDKVVQDSNVKPPERKLIDVVPEEVHIEEVDSHDKTTILPQRFVSKPPIKEEHKLEASNSNSYNILGGGVHEKEEVAEAKLNPSRLFNDSLFQQAGVTGSDGSEMKKQTEKTKSSTESAGEEHGNNVAYHGAIFQLVPMDKKSEKYVPASLDTLKLKHIAMQSLASDASHIVVHSSREKVYPSVEKQHDTWHNLIESKHDILHKAMENTHEKLQSLLGEKNDKLNAGEKEGNPEAITSEKYKTLSNPLPSVLFREILNTDDNVSKMSKTNKRGSEDAVDIKSADAKDILEDGENIAKENDDEAKDATQEEADVADDRATKQSKTEMTEETKDDMKDESKDDIKEESKGEMKEEPRGEMKEETKDDIKEESKADMKEETKGDMKEVKVDFDDLESIQLEGKDSIDASNEDESEGTGDDEYEDGSGAHDEIEGEKSAEHESEAVEPNLRGANEAIWKASEDIHALLHSLTDRAHADRVLGNLKEFIREKHGYDQGKKRNKVDPLNHNTTDLPSQMDIQISDTKKKPTLEKENMNVIPKMLQLKKSIIPRELEEKLNDLKKKKSEIPGMAEQQKESKENVYLPHKSYTVYNNTKADKRNIIQYDKYTNDTGHGIGRLYAQFATANSRTPPTFADDKDGWSSEEIRNIMQQLKTSDLEYAEAQNANNDNALRADYQEFGLASFTGYRHPEQQSIGLPQNHQHAVEAQPLKELMSYQKELQSEMLQNKVDKVNAIRSPSAKLNIKKQR